VAHPDLPESELIGTCNIYDLGPLIGEGAVVLERHTDLNNTLRNIRSGMLGLSGALTPYAACQLKAQLTQVERGYQERRQMLSEYNRLLSEYGLCDRMHFNHSDFPHYVLLKCENPRRVITYLEQYGIPAMHGVYGLHHFPAIKERYVDVPVYPNADAAQEQLVALPIMKTTEEAVQALKYFSEVML
jgi:dTDP-4-amino-4,6-dideoxygalactose transaminase